MILTDNGVLKLMQRIKSYIASQLNTKASSVHTHSISEIDNLESQLGGGGYTKSEVDTLLSNKANSSHTHTKSEITDFPTIPTKTSDLTNDSGFLTSHQDLSGYIPKSGGAVISGSSLGRNVDNGNIDICGGTNWENGAFLALRGKNNSNEPGNAILGAKDGTNSSSLILTPNGTFTFNNNGTSKTVAFQEDVVPRSGGSVLTATKLAKVDNNGDLDICGGTGYTQGGFVSVRGNNSASGASTVLIGCGTTTNSICLYPDGHTSCGTNFQPNPDNTYTLGAASKRWKTVYAATSTINTSDLRLKNTITNIDDSLLDAWETIQPKQYKFNDATQTKGETARFHTGYLAQDIEKACNDNNIDATRYGLFCYDSWEEEPEISEDVEVEKDGIKCQEKRIIRPKREKGDMYALRYEEALVVECAYLRRENTRLKEQMKELAGTVNELKSIINYSEIPNS